MKPPIKVFKTDFFFYLSTTLLAVFLGFLPLIYNLLTPVLSNKFNPLWDNWPYDFSYYLSIIKQGAQGSLQVVSKYTIEPQNPVFLRFSYALLGFIGGKILRFDPTFLYHLYRIIFSFLNIFVCFLFLQYFLKGRNTRRLIFTLFLFAGPFYSINPGQSITKFFQNFLPWATFLSTFRRNTFLPHNLLGNFSLILGLFLFFYSLDQKKPKITFLGAIILGFAGLDHPPTLIFFMTLIALYTVFNQFLKIEKNQKRLYGYLFVFLVPAILFCIYIYKASSLFPWNIQSQTRIQVGSFFEVLLALGPASILSLLSIVFIQKIKKSRILTLSFLWISLSLFLTFIVYKLHLFAQIRFLQVALPLPIAILSISFLKNLKISQKTLVFLTIFIIIGTLPGSLKDYYEQFRLIKSLSKESLDIPPMLPYIDYPSKSTIEAIFFLEKHTNPNQIVLSHFFAGNLIPAYSGNMVYFGHSTETYQFKTTKIENVIEFFSGKKSPQKAQEFLTKNKIKYVFYGVQEKNINPRFDIMTYNFLENIFKNPEVSIFEFPYIK